MYLTPEQQAILNGSKGETHAKVMKTLVMYGDAFGAFYFLICFKDAQSVGMILPGSVFT